ncbi:methyl-accepting chemotaxis protein [Castellaniella defragrans]|uniref:Methyl-accepting chemotaxis protein n=2 Tax=Castellaniella defragrans TaxID=75697 RepID=A0A7W9TKQ6_CASDE|nr:methyl-accepting chemotaxis protein [Castellaniella defragrans]MBB6082394.1 methyl-accepting chemotaxis protein [Castellaniella defragrans]
MRKITLTLSLRARLTLVVALLSLLTFAAVGSAWFVQRESQRTVGQLSAIGVQANSDVKNAYIYAQQAATQVDGALGITNEKQRLWELGQADQLLKRSRDGMASLQASGALAGSDGENLLHMLDASFKDYWAQVEQLRDFAAKQDAKGFEALKRGRLRGAARGMDRVFGQFDKFIQDRSSASRAELAQLFHWANTGLLALLVVAVVLALLAYRTLIRTVLRPLQAVGRHLQRIAGGDLRVAIVPRSSDEIGALLRDLKTMRDSLEAMISGVRGRMGQMADGAQRIAAGNLDLSSRTDEQAAALQQTAASMEQLASTVKQNADNAQQANQLAHTASQVASRGGEVVGEVVATMEGISGSSQKIADIVGVIDSIAFQTNILALNAAVEAARAGEQGRGFAVVAGEVRALAQRSAAAAKEIKGLIEDSVSRVGAGSAQVQRAGATMREIVEAVTRVSDIMSEITAATIEQSSGIDQINLAVAQMDSVTQQNALLVQQAAESAGSLESLAAEVNQALAVFQVGDAAADDHGMPPSAAAPIAAVPPAAALPAESAAGHEPAPAPASARRERPAPAAAPRLPAARKSAPARQPAREEEWEEF